MIQRLNATLLSVVLVAGLASSVVADGLSGSPVGETKAFHGTLRAKDLRLGTLGLSTSRSQNVSRILALDSQSRLVKGVYPATLTEFAIGDVIEGFAFPDQHGRMVVAVATARARPLAGSETGNAKAPKPRKGRASSGARVQGPEKSSEPMPLRPGTAAPAVVIPAKPAPKATPADPPKPRAKRVTGPRP